MRDLLVVHHVASPERGGWQQEEGGETESHEEDTFEVAVPGDKYVLV